MAGFTGPKIIVMGKKTKPDIVIEVVGYVPVAVRTVGVPTIIVPRAAAHHIKPFTEIIACYCTFWKSLVVRLSPFPNIAATIE